MVHYMAPPQRIVLYVPVEIFRALGSDRDQIRKICRAALQAELSEREHDSGGMTTSQPEGVGRISSDEKGPKAQPPIARSESSEDHFRPDFKPAKKKK